MAERKSGPVKPPVIDLKARDASQPADADKAAPKAAAKPVVPKPRAEAAPKVETVIADTPPAEPAAAEPRPEPVRPIPTPPAPPVRQQARLAMPWSAISIAAIGGALLGTLLTYLLVNVIAMPSNGPVIADPSDRLTELDGRLAGIEARIPAIEDSALETQVTLDASFTRMDTAIAAARTGVTGLEQRLAEVQASIPTAATVDLAPITAQLDSLEGRVSAIAAGASSADASELANSLNAIEGAVAALTARLDAADGKLAEIDSISADLATAKAAIAAQNQTLGGANIGPAVKLPLVVSGLETAFAAGRPYVAELDSLKALLPDLSVPEAVTAAATTGLTRADALLVQFDAVVPAILAGRTAQSTGDWGKDAVEWAKALLALRPAGEMEGNTPEAIVSRLEAAMERRDFVGATGLLDQLPEAMQAAAGPVATEIRTHATADGFLAALRAQALAPVTEASP